MPLVPGPRLPAPARRVVRRSVLAFALALCLATVAVVASRTADRPGQPPTSQLLASTAGVTTHTLAATGDATTRADAPTATSGTGPSLRVDGAPVVRSFLRFDVPDAGPIQRATLQLHAETANRVGFDVRGAAGSWSERTLTHANAPTVGAVAGSSGRLAAGQDVSVDVTTLAQPGALLNLAITTSSPTNTRFTSREGGAKGPRLILVTVDPQVGEDDPGAGEGPSAPGGTGDWQPTAPIRAGFYYPWFPEAWRQQGKDPFSVYQPSAGYYDSSSAAVIAGHIDAMRYAGMQTAISSWWGPGTATDLRFPLLLKGAAGTPFRWSVYYEQEGQRDPSVAELTADLIYLRDHYGKDPSYLRIGGRFVVFVYGGAESCEMVDRWRQANTVGAYVALKVFSGYQDCAAQPDAWHQYGPAVAASSHLPWSVTVSPGFHKATEPAPRLDRDLDRWRRDVEAMAASPAQFHLVTTFNEWGEGTAVESSTSWASSSGYGRYLDVLHQVQPPAPVRASGETEPLRVVGDPVIAATGDMACDPGSGSFKGGAGGRTACHQQAVSNLVVGRDLAAFLPLGMPSTRTEPWPSSKPRTGPPTAG